MARIEDILIGVILGTPIATAVVHYAQIATIPGLIFGQTITAIIFFAVYIRYIGNKEVNQE